MTAENLQVSCPYCGLEFETGRPVRPKKSAVKEPFKVESLPYTRDVGRFDPKTASERTAPAGWTQVCKDYMTLLGFERIGILRQEPGTTVDVMYRVQYCPGCKRLFDVFANYTPGKNLSAIWPHLFTPVPGDQEDIGRYAGISWPIWAAQAITRRLGIRKIEYGSVLLALVFLLMGVFPWLFHRGWLQPTQETRTLWMTLLIYTVAAAGMGALLVILTRFVQSMQCGEDFYDLFKTTSRRGVSYWYNYTLCRFVGAQVDGRMPRISQVEIWGSGLALLSMLLVWAVMHLNRSNMLPMLGLFVAFMLLVWLMRRVLRASPRRSIVSIVIALLVLTLSVVLLSSDRLGSLLLLAEIIFWSTFAYMVGMGAWVAMSATLYVLKGVTRVPMRISPLTQFKELNPLLDIQRFSTSVMAVLFVSLVSLVFLLEIFSDALPHLYWMVYWLELALAVLFAAIAVGLRPVFLLVTAAYIALTIFSYSNPALPAAWNINLDLFQVNLIVFGGFLTFIMYFHLHESRSYIDKIITIEKDSMLQEIDLQIARLRAYAAQVSGEGFHSKDKNQFFEYTQGLHGLEALLTLRKTIQTAQFRSANFAARVISPLLWSIVLPSVWDFFAQNILDRWFY